jgi:integrase
MASLFKEPGGRWRIQFKGKDNKRRSIRPGKMSREMAQSIKLKVERLVAASITGHVLDNETANWVADLDTVMLKKLVAVRLVPKREVLVATSLGEFMAAYMQTRTDIKPGTAVIWRQGKASLLEFFGKDTPVADISPGDADEYKIFLTTKKVKGGSRKISLQTADRHLRFAKLIFRAATRKQLIAESPFEGVSIKFADTEHDHFVTHEDTHKLIDACPNYTWRIIVALSRFAGLRCPSEVLSLRLEDIDWEHDKITVQSPKTEHHPGKATRVIPIFTALRPYLLEACEQAPEGATYVVSDKMRQRADGPNGWVNCNLRTQMQKIVKRAGLTPWARLFHNLRASCQTELEDEYASHAVCTWMGNSPKVARKHYLKVTDEHFQRATHGGAKSGAPEVQNPAQQAGEGKCVEVKTTPKEVNDAGANPVENSTSHENAPSCTLSNRFNKKSKVSGIGLEPTTSTMSTLRSNQLS